jgi:isopenicillin-N epimerase
MTSQPAAEDSLWGAGWADLRRQWLIDPSVVFLNHGSFGACPTPVLERQSALRREMERQPVEFLWRRLSDLSAEARRVTAAFLRAGASTTAFVPNATTGVATVLAGLPVGPGDRIVLTDHAYPAVIKAVRKLCARTGAQADVRSIHLPLPDPEEVTAILTAGLDERVRLVVVEHVTSPTAAVLPVERVVAECRIAGVPVLVDAAHGPGMVPIDVGALRPDFWTGNFHKWVCAPKGAAVLWVAPGHQSAIRPLVPSHGYGGSFLDEFDWTGTHDPTPYLCIPEALSFFDRLGWERVRAHNHELVLYGRDVVAAAVGTGPMAADRAIGAMAVVRLPPGVAVTEQQARALQAKLYEAARIEVPITAWNGIGLLRLSAQIYNHPSEYDLLAGVLKTLI